MVNMPADLGAPPLEWPLRLGRGRLADSPNARERNGAAGKNFSQQFLPKKRSPCYGARMLIQAIDRARNRPADLATFRRPKRRAEKIAGGQHNPLKRLKTDKRTGPIYVYDLNQKLR
jgi:hypothetical protein